jgi:1-acyl-sn-glycerol-3-phosphate acyltransferase
MSVGRAEGEEMGDEAGDQKTHRKGSLLNWLHARHGVEAGMDPRALREEAVLSTLRWARKLFGDGKYFPLTIDGWERVPRGPAMMVSNHSGGTTIPDVWGFMVAWYDRFGLVRPLHPLAHDMILSTRTTGSFFEQRGVLRANAKVALSALADHGRDILVMPGGDLDTWRPYSARYEVRFSERLGYVRTALRAGVPLVPMANAGAHETFYVLSDGRGIARALRLPQIARAEIFPIHLSLPWGLALGPWPHLPLPARLRYRIAEPIVPDRAYAPDEPIPDATVREIDAAVRTSIQALLERLRDEDPREMFPTDRSPKDPQRERISESTRPRPSTRPGSPSEPGGTWMNTTRDGAT